MRAAYGAMWIFAICLVFTIMMTAYLAISVNYAKAFRVKNHIISMIEEHEGYSRSLEESIDEYFTNQGYTARGQCRETISVRGYEEDWQLVQGLDPDETGNYGACVYRVMTGNTKNGPTERARYRVLTFFKFDIPVVSSFLTFQVGGESRYIYNFAS